MFDVSFQLIDQTDDAGAFDRGAEHLLMIQAGAGDAAGQNLAFFSLEFLQRFGILEVDVFDFGFAETANLRFGRAFAAALSSFSVFHSFVLPLLFIANLLDV